MNAELWQRVCARVDRLRHLKCDDYAVACGLDPTNDAFRVQELHRGRHHLAPEYLAPLLDVEAKVIQTEFPGEDLEMTKTAIAARAYGPMDDQPPPESEMQTIAREARWGTDADQRGLERVLCYGASLPLDAAASQEWSRNWPRAFRTLGYVVKAVRFVQDKSERASAAVKRPRDGDIQQNLRWLQGKGLLNHEAADGVRNRHEEAVYAALVRGSLVVGCTCPVNWDALSLKNRESADEYCHSGHALRAWEGDQPLNEFVWKAAITTNLPHVNGFRRGIFASYVCQFNNLAIYPVLLCEQTVCDPEKCGCQRCHGGRADKPCTCSRCRREIDQNNRCPQCGIEPGVKRTSYVIDKTGNRVATDCRRCLKCSRLFFTVEKACPDCGGRMSSKATTVWIRARQNSSLANLPAGLGQPTAAAKLDRLQTEFNKLDEREICAIADPEDPPPAYSDQLKALFQAVREGKNWTEASRQVGIPDQRSRIAREHVLRVLRWLASRLFDNDDPGQLED